jgi:hypothetical protein
MTASLTLVAVAEQPSPLSPAREALRCAIAAFEKARTLVEERQRPVARGAALAEAADRAEAEYARLRDDRELLTGEALLAGGERPAPSNAEQSAKRVAEAARADAAAAARALPPMVEARNEAITALQRASGDREMGIGAVLADEVAAALLGELAEAISRSLQVEVRLRAICSTLREHTMGGLAERVEAGIRRVKAEAGVQHRPEWARQYWAGLAADPAYTEEQ